MNSIAKRVGSTADTIEELYHAIIPIVVGGVVMPIVLVVAYMVLLRLFPLTSALSPDPRPRRTLHASPKTVRRPSTTVKYFLKPQPLRTASAALLAFGLRQIVLESRCHSHPHHDDCARDGAPLCNRVMLCPVRHGPRRSQREQPTEQRDQCPLNDPTTCQQRCAARVCCGALLAGCGRS